MTVGENERWPIGDEDRREIPETIGENEGWTGEIEDW